MTLCPDCSGRGLVHICYRVGREESIAYCTCEAGAIWKRFGAIVVRARLGLAPDFPVTELAWVTGDLVPLSEAPIAVQRALKLAGLGKPQGARVRPTTRRKRA